MGDSLKYLYIGNRYNVLRRMLDLGLNVTKIIAVKNSFLTRELNARGIAHSELPGREELFADIAGAEFDVLVSAGCPYILPVSRLRKNGQLFINVHPALLPEFRGKHPVNGAIIQGRHAGATCHLMDDGVDSGGILAQADVGQADQIDLGLLYQLCFMAEEDAFLKAYATGFKAILAQDERKASYYARQESDCHVDFRLDAREVVRKIRAFGIPSQGSFFSVQGRLYKVLDAAVIENEYLLSKADAYRELEIAFAYDDSIVIKKDRGFLALKRISGKPGLPAVGEFLDPVTAATGSNAQ